MENDLKIPGQFQEAVKQIVSLKNKNRYQGAFVFGSVARGDSNQSSDLDVQVVINEENKCKNVNRLKIGDVYVDITFASLSQIESLEKKPSKRIPRLAESIILFDKTGGLQVLCDHLKSQPREALPKSDYTYVRFMLTHISNKVNQTIQQDPNTALLIMHTSLIDIINYQYDIKGHWRVSDKRMLADLTQWDPLLTKLLKCVIRESNIKLKAEKFSDIIDYVLSFVGEGFKEKDRSNRCACKTCVSDLAFLLYS